MNINLTQSKEQGTSLNAEHKRGRLQIKKRIYNKAFKNFINDTYGSGIHFGNMNSNLEEILRILSLDHLMEGMVKIPKIDSNTLSVIKEEKNEFSDFDLYDNFECTFVAKDEVDSQSFMKGIEKLQNDFLDTYNQKAHEEFVELDYVNRLQVKKRELKEIIFFTVLSIIALIFIYFFLK